MTELRDKIAAFLDDARNEGLSDQAIADALIAALPGMVAPLVWAKSYGDLVADAPLFGRIRIKKYLEGFIVTYSVPGFSGALIPGKFPSVEAAIAAANTHHAAAVVAAFKGVRA
jgi:hypothetical protein